MSEYQVLLYYNYTNIEDPAQLVAEQQQLCRDLGLRGRIIVAREGINGTLEGHTAATERYVTALLADPRFAITHIKRSPGTGCAFPKLSVKVRTEIVSSHLGLADIDPTRLTGLYICPDQLHAWFEQGKEFYIVDMRNDYEQEVGYFAGSILSRFGNFRDLPLIVHDLAHLKHLPIVTVCTGGVRCEKASGFLVKHGFSHVYQLAGGIVSYMEMYPNQHFLGKLYVFDQRVIMGFNTSSPDHVVVGRCALCGRPSEDYVNCANNYCHWHFICCQECRQPDGSALCSQPCRHTMASMTQPVSASPGAGPFTQAN